MKKTVFLDRDGVINEEIGYLHKIEDFKFIRGIFDACLHIQSKGYQIIIITNQSGIGRGYFTTDDFVVLNHWMLQQFQKQNIHITDVLFCPHNPNSNCNCRKPKPGMLLSAKLKYNIDMEKSWLIGDNENDIKAANFAGITSTILVRSGHPIDEYNSSAKYFLDSIQNIGNVITD
jgi:D-glycero-D-manno-heptose 1,7-bisphosphate phosphatase